jgi:hypothetical protein
MEGWIQREMKSESGREEGNSAHVGSASDCHRDRGLSQIPHCMDFDSRKGKQSGLNELCLMNCHKRLKRLGGGGGDRESKNTYRWK